MLMLLSSDGNLRLSLQPVEAFRHPTLSCSTRLLQEVEDEDVPIDQPDVQTEQHKQTSSWRAAPCQAASSACVGQIEDALG